MITENRKKEAKQNFSRYLKEGLLKKEQNETAKRMYLKNSDMSLKIANELIQNKLCPYIWVIVISYYSMFYVANSAILHLGYKTGSKIVHRVTSDALIVLLLERLTEQTLNEYEQTRSDAQELAMINSEQTIQEYEFELKKRARFQYEMTTDINKKIAETSLKRAKNFTMELKKLMQSV